MLSKNLGSNLAAKFGDIRQYLVGNVKIWRGATVVLRLLDGLAYPAQEDVSDSLKQLVVGFALEEGTPASGATVRVRRDAQLARDFPGVTQDAIGKLALVKDDQSVQTYGDAFGKTVCGRITSIQVEGLSVFVDFKDIPMRTVTNAYN